MINTIRLWNRAFTKAEEVQAPRYAKQKRSQESREGFIESFVKLFESQADLVVRNLNKD